MNELFGDYAILAVNFDLAPSGGISMQFAKRNPPEAQYPTCPGAHAKRREVVLGCEDAESACYIRHKLRVKQ
jgi:hypothetical protein